MSKYNKEMLLQLIVKRNVPKFCSIEKLAGMVPVKVFFARLILVRLDKEPMPSGIVPLRLSF
jgi:hypothetical protein